MGHRELLQRRGIPATISFPGGSIVEWTFDSRAVAAYEAKAASILDAVENVPSLLKSSTQMIESNESDIPITRSFTSEDFDRRSLRFYLLDGRETRRGVQVFTTSRGLVTIDGEAYTTLSRLSEKIAAERAWKTSIGPSFIEEQLVRWVQRSIDGDERSAFDFVVNAAAQAVQSFEVWLPIPTLSIVRSFTVGRTTFRRITREMMDELWEHVPEKSEENRIGFDLHRSELQGHTAACVSVLAEPETGNTHAVNESDAAIALVRLCCPALLTSRLWTAADPSFVGRIGGPRFLHVREGQVIREHDSLPAGLFPRWNLTAAEIERHYRATWTFADGLLSVERTPYQSLLLGALIHYSKSCLKSDVSERLLYVIAALEQILVQERSLIEQNLARRVSTITARDENEVKEHTKVVQKVYDQRSRFVHDGRAVREADELDRFLRLVWGLMLFLLRNHKKFVTKEALISLIDWHAEQGSRFTTRGIVDVGPNGRI